MRTRHGEARHCLLGANTGGSTASPAKVSAVFPRFCCVYCSELYVHVYWLLRENARPRCATVKFVGHLTWGGHV